MGSRWWRSHRVQSLWEIQTFWGLLFIKSSHLCNQWGYRHQVGFNVQLNNFAIFQIHMKSLSLGLVEKYQSLCCELPIFALNAVVMSAKCSQK